MADPLFPIQPLQTEMLNTVFIIEPYLHEGAWVFDDPTVGLVREPFVSGITGMIDRLVAQIPNAAQGFRLFFAVHAFDGYQTTLKWVRTDPVEGNWYQADDVDDEGWLCPALFCYFPAPPDNIYIRAEPKTRETN